ncbi:hypothetical protein [Clostridium thermopalmarium]|uniref:hypothetical protein n=1 Tax=Clostridium thermopalmarium TaxID=29373 RepID=UPI0014036EE1|nr:hypothetical protein [Clostridium thermopalmarium]
MSRMRLPFRHSGTYHKNYNIILAKLSQAPIFIKMIISIDIILNNYQWARLKILLNYT